MESCTGYSGSWETVEADELLVILIGSKACGKSTVGSKLARMLALPFEDADDVLESAYADRIGARLGFREIYRKEGPEAFATLEAEAVGRCLRAGDRVVALGGGAPARIVLDSQLDEGSLVIYLTVPEDVLWERMIRDGLPAYLDPGNPREDFRRSLGERIPLYERLADLRIDANRDPEMVAEEIAAEVNVILQERTTTPSPDKNLGGSS